MHRHGLDRVIESAPEVFNHNMETVPAPLSKSAWPQERLQLDARLLARVKELNPAIKTKSGLMLGLGETRDELLECLTDLRKFGCDFPDARQYLQPGLRYLPVQR